MLDSSARWSQAVNALHFEDSCCESAAAPSQGGGGTRPFACHIAAFATAKARDQHLRIQHGVRCLQRSFAPASAVCPVCGTQFGSRLRLLAHLCDSRRTTCWYTIRGNPIQYPPLPAAQVAELDEADILRRRSAQQLGYSHALARGPARRADGSVVPKLHLQLSTTW